MALKKTVVTPHGFNAIDAYHRVEAVRLIGTSVIAFQVRSRKDATSPHFSDVEFEAAYDLNGDNPVAQAYAHLKMLPEFSDAVDC